MVLLCLMKQHVGECDLKPAEQLRKLFGYPQVDGGTESAA